VYSLVWPVVYTLLPCLAFAVSTKTCVVDIASATQRAVGRGSRPPGDSRLYAFRSNAKRGIQCINHRVHIDMVSTANAGGLRAACPILEAANAP